MKKFFVTLLSLSSVFTISACSSNETVLSDFQQLRSPEGLSHSYDYYETKSEGYLLFKNKVRALSILQELISEDLQEFQIYL